MKKVKKFMTYEQFFKEISKVENFSTEIMGDRIQVFFNFDKDIKRETNYSREPIFTIGMQKAFEIVTPFGYRFIQFKSVRGFNDVSELALNLSRTPIELRGGV